MQTSSGVLMPTPKGKRSIGHYSSYPVFTSGEEPLAVTVGKSLEQTCTLAYAPLGGSGLCHKGTS